MARQLTIRILRLLGVLWVVSVLSFLIVDLIPGDPALAILGNTATPDQIETLRAEMGLDQPMTDRYVDWLGGLLRGDFGETVVRPIEPVADVMARALPVTLELAFLAMLISLVIGLPLGAWAAARQDKGADRIITTSAFGLLAVPVFVMGLLLIQLFVFNNDLARRLALALGVLGTLYVLGRGLVPRASRGARATSAGWWVGCFLPAVLGLLIFMFLPTFPRQGWVPLSESLSGNLRSAFLPALTLALGIVPVFVQLLRSDMVTTLQQNFIVIARAKGMSERHVIVREALRPSLFSLVTVAGLVTGGLLGGSIVVETLFGLPGLGQELVESIQAKDLPVVQIGILIAAAIFLVINSLVDVTYYLLEPRIRRAGH